MTLTEIYEGLSFFYTGGTGGVPRKFVVQGMPIAPTNPSDNLALAVQSIGLPAYAEAHPTIPDLYVSGYETEAWPQQQGSTSKTGLLVTVNYSVPTAAQPLGGVYREVSSSNGQFIKNRWEAGDQKGQPILVGFKGNNDGTPGADPNYFFPTQIDPAQAIADINNPASGVKYDSVSFQTDSPNVLIVLTRMEKSAIAPMAYRHTLNSSSWQGFEPETVYMREIHAQYVFGIGLIPSHFVVTFIAEAAPSKDYWEHVEIKRDWQTGQACIVDLLDGTGNGYTRVGRAESDFNELKFPQGLLLAS